MKTVTSARNKLNTTNKYTFIGESFTFQKGNIYLFLVNSY